MKILLSFGLILCLFVSSFASTLILKVTKEIKVSDNQEYVELVTFDSSKYKKLRIGVIKTDGNFSDAVSLTFEAVEGEDTVFLKGATVYKSNSVEIDTPPSKIRILAKMPGAYKILVWAN